MSSRRVLLSLLALIVLLLVVILGRSLTFRSVQPEVQSPVTEGWADGSASLTTAADHLSKSIQIAAVTYEDRQQIKPEHFLAFFDSLSAWYPGIHRVMERERIGNYSLLFTWEGSDSDAEAVVLASHIDVVPVPAISLNDWDADPFSGEIRDGYIWGRGALDAKLSLIGVMEAVEYLIDQGFEPRRTLILAFGGDEERGGYLGAKVMAELLASRGIRATLVLDEGLFIMDGIVPGITQPVALIGVAEKGAANIELSVNVDGGHGSMPNNPTALGLLSHAIDELTENPLEPTLEGVPTAMFSALAPEMAFLERTIFANLWLFGPLVKTQLAAAPSSNALMRTTIAPTMLNAGTKANVLPSEARALLNVRLRPGDTVDGVVQQIKNRIGDDRVQVRSLEGASEPSAISPMDSVSYALMSQTMRNVFPEALVAPALMIARTDSRHYSVITDNIFKITPVQLIDEDLKQVHGVNERLSIESLGQAIRFYHELIIGAQDMDAP